MRLSIGLARILQQTLRKIGRGFNGLVDFLTERHIGAYGRRPLSPVPGLRGIWTSCPAEKILQAVKDSARAQHAVAICGLVIFVAMPAAALAESAYVTDNLRLGLHRAEDTSDRAFRTLESGQAVEILSRDRNYAHVQLPDGAQGYLKAAYLVIEKPARLIVAETRAENEKLVRQLADTKQAFASPAATIAALENDVEQRQAALDEKIAKVQELTQENDKYRKRHASYKYNMPLPWVAGALGVCLLTGFLFGLWLVDYRSRRRHGGVRIL